MLLTSHADIIQQPPCPCPNNGRAGGRDGKHCYCIIGQKDFYIHPPPRHLNKWFVVLHTLTCSIMVSRQSFRNTVLESPQINIQFVGYLLHYVFMTIDNLIV